MRRAGLAAIGFALGASFYLLLVDTAGEVELFATVGLGTLAAGAFVVSREQAFTEAAISPRCWHGAGGSSRRREALARASEATGAGIEREKEG